MLLGLLSSRSTGDSATSLVLRPSDDSPAASTDVFLSSKLRFTRDGHGQDICLLKVADDEEVGVMMGWEREIMEETVKVLCHDHPQAKDLKVLNVGFGLGIVSVNLSLRGFHTHIITGRSIPYFKIFLSDHHSTSSSSPTRMSCST